MTFQIVAVNTKTLERTELDWINFADDTATFIKAVESFVTAFMQNDDIECLELREGRKCLLVFKRDGGLMYSPFPLPE